MDAEIWDEDRWEEFLQETDRQLERYMSILFLFLKDDPPAGEPGSAKRKDWEGRLRVYLLSHGMRPDASGPRQWGEALEDDDGDGQPPEDHFVFFEMEEAESAASSLERIALYDDAHRLATRVLRWSNTLPGVLKDSTFVQFCSHVTTIPANIAKGHGIGYEMEMIGGNIACAKRALDAANTALDLLREMKEAAYMRDDVYRPLYEDLFHVRNDLGIRVQELRARFDLGVD
ncbi:MAG: four helix bundle protein [Rhodothermales bacterium]